MQIWRSLEEIPDGLDPTVVVVGNFDGVHLGHRAVVAQACAQAADDATRVVAVTFDPHPMAVLRPEHAPQMLTTLEQRARLLAEAGVDDVFAIPFSREVASWSPEEFVQRVLVDALHARTVVVGANFRFGAKAAGDVALLQRVGPDHGFTTRAVPLDGGPQVWSSTYVRACLAAGDVEGAAQALGRAYALAGTVVRGDQRGRELGYPTANVPPGVQAVPADGVYAGHLRRLDEPGALALPAAISVGTNPTFDGTRERRVEAYVIDRVDLELYSVEVEVDFVARVRGMTRFDSVEELVEQMALDVRRCRELLAP
ncbi:riboflavin biosynthesis protein [Marmoricola endophyticus]|uniref:Riboflavin biosynthesis protein n=1 Tax=Marmoricola endophyticus TaxID=2040280 RepID=A0A917F2I7_9ACTN|nr:bifunctional riboflavin kinase/FAD synthetase [Marmoricola endophyticus]GGF38479.1 riboflavin biosynthesis protein [Marmoricola endophyticus]